MPDAEATVLKAIRSLLRRRKGVEVEVSGSSDLTDDLMMDSLETAELSAMLEEDLGSDPYTEGLVPQTVTEVIDFYNS